MRAYYLACAVCGALDTQRLHPPPAEEVQSVVQAIVICRCCGLVYRNPYIRDVSAPARDSNLQSEERDRAAAGQVAARVPLKANDFSLEIGCGRGWFAEKLAAKFPRASAVLLQPDLDLAAEAKRRNLRASLLPSVLSEAQLPENAFTLIVARGVDHRFANHRRDLETIVTLMRDGGTLYLERSVFVDTWSPDPMTNTWFGRDQFVEYLDEFVEVFETIDDGDVRAVYGRKRTGGEKKLPAEIRNRYAEHMEILRLRG